MQRPGKHTRKQIKKWPALVKSAVLIGALVLFVYAVLAMNGTDEQEYAWTVEDADKFAGLYVNDPRDFLGLDPQPEVAAWFQKLGEISENKLRMGLDEGVFVPFISLEPMEQPLEGIASGQYDETISEFFHLLSDDGRTGRTIYVRFAHEMELSPGGTAWYPWQTTDPGLYVEAWRRFVALGREIAPNARFIWSPNRLNNTSRAYYPGDEYVDYISCTLNNMNGEFRTFRRFAEAVHLTKLIETYNKHFILSECAVHCDDAGRKAEYIYSIFEYLEESDHILGVVLLDADVSEARQYRFTDDPLCLEAFEKGLELIGDE